MGLLSDERSAMGLERKPESGLDITPEPIVPAGPPRSRGDAAASVGLAVLTHVGFAALAVMLLQWRDLGVRSEQAIPVEIVLKAPPELAAAAPTEPAPSPAVATPAPLDAQQAAVEPKEAPPPPPQTDSPKEPMPPMLIEAPPEAAPAKTQPAVPQQANLEPEKPSAIAAKPPAPAAEAPAVLTSAGGVTAVPPPAPAPPDQRPPAAKPVPAAPERDTAAELAAALPMDLSALPSSFRAVLSGGGQLPSDEYKGVVFGHLGRARGAIAEAKERHLRGTVLVSFTVADDGKIADLRVGHSSGTPALDALALQMVREAAPFPPPPPHSQRSFNPVLSFGEH